MVSKTVAKFDIKKSFSEGGMLVESMKIAKLKQEILQTEKDLKAAKDAVKVYRHKLSKLNSTIEVMRQFDMFETAEEEEK